MRLATVILSFIILMQSCHIGFSDVLGLGELAEHAKFHKQKYGDNFFIFLSKHYGELKNKHTKNHQEESSKHKKLPFKEHQHMCMADFQIILFKVNDFTLKKMPFISKTTTFFYKVSYISPLKKGVFKPPRLS